MAFDPCPPALQSGRIASWVYTDRMEGAWFDIAGVYSLANRNTTRVQKTQQGRTILGAGSLCDYDAQECWSTSEPAIVRVNANFTKCGVTFHTRADFGAQSSAIGFIASAPQRIAHETLTTGGPGFAWVYWTRTTGGTGSTTPRTVPLTEPSLDVVKYDDATGDLTYQSYLLSTGERVFHHVYTATSINDRTTDYYGRSGGLTAPSATYAGSTTIIDCIQVFDSVLDDTDLQAICSRIQNQRDHIRRWIKYEEMSA